ncbi:hypothetical protein FRX31_019809, partial [Thalictrum thalictroides]
MEEDELPKRNLRFHYGGNFKEIGKVPSMLHMYSGGETVDSCDWNGDEVCLMDLVKEVEKLVSIPECCKVKLWCFWLSHKDGYVNQKLLVDKDTDVMFLWKNAKPDKGNFIHLYIEVENKMQAASTSVPPLPSSVINNTSNEALQFSQGKISDVQSSKKKNPSLGGKVNEDTYVNPFDDPEVNTWYADDEVDRNKGNVDFNISQDDSNDDEDYAVSDFECDISVLNQKYEVSTRSKGSPLIDVNRIDAAEDYESPHSATDSETDDDIYCDDDLTQEEIQKSKDRLAADAREYARKRAAERRKLTAIKEKELCVEQQKKQQQEIDDDITWINRTSSIKDDEYVVEDNTDEEGLPTLKVDQSYCSPYFTVAAYKDVYEGSIKPILHETDWCKTTEEIQPPIRPRAPGRPPMNRRRGLDEGPIQYSGKRQHRCTICKEYGHNKTTCMGGGAECDAMQAAIAASLAAASQPPPPKGATPKGGRPRTRARKIVIGQPLESAFGDEDLLSNGRGKGKGKAKTNASGRGKGAKGRGRDNATNGHPEYSYSTMSE